MTFVDQIALITPEGQPAPSVMSIDEVAHILLLDRTKVKNPRASVQRYIELGRLKALRVGRDLRVTDWAVLEFLRRETEQEPKGRPQGRKTKLIE